MLQSGEDLIYFMFVAPAVKTNKSVALTILTRQSVLTAHSLVSDNILCSVSVCRVLALLVTFNMSQARARGQHQ